MGLRMNNFNIMGFTEKSDITENQYIGGLPKNREEAWTVYKLKLCSVLKIFKFLYF